MNNSKFLLFVTCLFALTVTAPLVTATPRGGGHFTSMPARGGHTFARSGMGTFSGRNDRNDRFRRFDNDRDDRFFRNRFVSNRVVFIGDFGFPGWWGWGWPYWGWGYGYPYGYGYGYPYGYGYGYPYGYGYGYGYGGNQYGDSGYGRYGDSSRGRVAELQRRLARAGYYRGAVDGVMGPQTRRAIRAYERDHGYAG